MFGPRRARLSGSDSGVPRLRSDLQLCPREHFCTRGIVFAKRVAPPAGAPGKGERFFSLPKPKRSVELEGLITVRQHPPTRHIPCTQHWFTIRGAEQILTKKSRGQEGKRARGQEGKRARGQGGKRARRQEDKSAKGKGCKRARGQEGNGTRRHF